MLSYELKLSIFRGSFISSPKMASVLRENKELPGIEPIHKRLAFTSQVNVMILVEGALVIEKTPCVSST